MIRVSVGNTKKEAKNHVVGWMDEEDLINLWDQSFSKCNSISYYFNYEKGRVAMIGGNSSQTECISNILEDLKREGVILDKKQSKFKKEKLFPTKT